MKKKKVLISLLIGVIIISGSVWYYTLGPTSFLTEEQIVEEMVGHYSIVSNSVIQDIIFLDDRHEIGRAHV